MSPFVGQPQYARHAQQSRPEPLDNGLGIVNFSKITDSPNPANQNFHLYEAVADALSQTCCGLDAAKHANGQ